MSYAGTPVSYSPLTITSNTFTLTVANDMIEVNKTTGSATAIAFAAMNVDHPYQVVDAKGDSATNPITVTTTLGDGKIDGQSSAVINTANESLTFEYDGTTTKIV